MSIWISVAPPSLPEQDDRLDANRERPFVRRHRPRNLGEFLKPVEATPRHRPRRLPWGSEQAAC